MGPIHIDVFFPPSLFGQYWWYWPCPMLCSWVYASRIIFTFSPQNPNSNSSSRKKPPSRERERCGPKESPIAREASCRCYRFRYGVKLGLQQIRFGVCVNCLLSPATGTGSFQIRFCLCRVQSQSRIYRLGLGLEKILDLGLGFRFRLCVLVSVSVSVSNSVRWRVRTDRVVCTAKVTQLKKNIYTYIKIYIPTHFVAKIGSSLLYSGQCCALHCQRYANYRKDTNHSIHHRLQSLWQDSVAPLVTNSTPGDQPAK